MPDKDTYIVTAQIIHGAEPLKRGDLVELSQAEYETAFWRTRAVPADTLEAAEKLQEQQQAPASRQSAARKAGK